MNELLANITPRQLRRAADLSEKIEALQNELGSLFGSLAQAESAAMPRRNRTFSPATRAKMRAAQKARWAKIKGSTPSDTPTRKAKRNVSAAARARLSQLAKARWKKAKAQGKATL